MSAADSAMPPEPLVRFEAGAALALGFATAGAMWTVGYLTHLPGVNTPGPLALSLLMFCVLAGGFFGRRLTADMWVVLLAALVTGCVNLLILGSLAKELASENMLVYAGFWAPGSIMATAAVMLAGASLADRFQKPSPRPVNWRAAFLGVLVLLTGVLIWIGGTVTAVDAGLAVPDWPATFGFNMFFYPLAKMNGGIFHEHAHRLFGSLVGLTTLAMMIHTFRADRRGWVRGVAVAAFVLVCVQGVLGGLRVTELDVRLAMMHGVLAQIFLSILVLLWAASTRAWSALPVRADASAGFERGFAFATLAMLLLQLVFGVLLRHLSWGLHLHITGAVFVIGLVAHLGMRLAGRYADCGPLRRIGMAVLLAVCCQFVLGFGAWIAVTFKQSGETAYFIQAIVTTLHQSLGAAVLALTVALIGWHLRLVRSPLAAQAQSASIRLAAS